MIKNDLDQIDQLIQKRLDTSNKQLRQGLRENIRQDIKAEVDPLHERLDGQQNQFANVQEQIREAKKDLSAQITREAQDIVSILSDVIVPKLQEHDDQIAELQEEAGIKPRKH